MLHKNILQKWRLLINNFIVLRNENGWISFKFWDNFHLMVNSVSTCLNSFVIVWLKHNNLFVLFSYLRLRCNLLILFFCLLNFSHFLLTYCQYISILNLCNLLSYQNKRNFCKKKFRFCLEIFLWIKILKFRSLVLSFNNKKSFWIGKKRNCKN